MTTDSNTTRRAALATLAGTPLLAGSIAMTLATGAEAAPIGSHEPEPAFAALLARFRELDAICETFHRDCEPVYAKASRARKQWEAACAKVPHIETATKYKASGGDMRGLSTANAGHVAAARFVTEKGTNHSADYGGACGELMEAVEKREAEKKALRKRFDLDALEESSRAAARESDRHSDASGAALRQVLAYPATSLATALAKLDLMDELDLTQDADPTDFENIAGDIRRIACRFAS